MKTKEVSGFAINSFSFNLTHSSILHRINITYPLPLVKRNCITKMAQDPKKEDSKADSKGGTLGNLDKQIEQLQKCEYISEAEVKNLCQRAMEILMEESNVQRVDPPVIV